MSYSQDHKSNIEDNFSTKTLNFNFINISVIWFIWILVCLIPITIDEYGINYLFMLTPIFYVLAGGSLYQLHGILKILAILSIIVFLVATIYQTEYYDIFYRRLISFILFMSIFSLAVIKIKLKEFNSILLAIIVTSCVISLKSIFYFYTLGLVENAAQAKDEVGSQRYGFMLVFSFWAILWNLKDERYLIKIFKLALATLLLCGIFLTFSRSSIVALLASGLVYLTLRGNQIRVIKLFNPLIIISVTLLISLFYLIIEHFFPSIIDFFNNRLFGLLFSGRIFDNLENHDASEGVRLRIWGDIIWYVFQNPFTGSGFLGSWVMMDYTGSAHNQYMDVLLRIGFIGFIVYIMLILCVCRTLLMANPLLFCGFIGALVYGIFHETFKEPNGSLLLAFLVSYYSSTIE